MTAHPSSSDSLLATIIHDTADGDRLLHCLQCGSCGGSCPNASDMDRTPRAIFALLAAGDDREVLSANTAWMCVSCYLCTVRCPQEIPITDIMSALKREAGRRHKSGGTDAPALTAAFSHFVDKYGRSFEFGLASRFYLLNKPTELLKLGPMGLALWKRRRLSLIPTRIRGTDGLRAILAKARELSSAQREAAQ